MTAVILWISSSIKRGNVTTVHRVLVSTVNMKRAILHQPLGFSSLPLKIKVDGVRKEKEGLTADQETPGSLLDDSKVDQRSAVVPWASRSMISHTPGEL